MSVVIRISTSTYKRLEEKAQGFDTPSNVIERLLDYFDEHNKSKSGFEPDDIPPKRTHRTREVAMDDVRLDRYLKSVGMKCFTRYFEYFMDDNLTNSEIADKIFNENKYTYKACNSRTGHSRMIIRGGRAKDALDMVVHAKRVEASVAQQAKDLMVRYFSQVESDIS